MGDSLPIPTVRMVWAGVCPAGLVGGQDTQPGSTRTPSPAVAVVAGGSSSSGLSTRTYLGGGPGNAAHSTNGPDRQIARNPRRPAVPLWGGDIPRAPGCSLGVTICWLWGDTQPSRLTCSSIPATTDRIGTPRSIQREPVRHRVSVPAVLTLCGCGRSTAAPPWPLCTVGIRL